MENRRSHTVHDLLSEIRNIKQGDLFHSSGETTCNIVESVLGNPDHSIELGSIAWIYLRNLLVNYTVNPETHRENLDLFINNILRLRPVSVTVGESNVNMTQV